MNANELAGLMELAPTYIQYRQEAATMLRQQHDRLCLLENIVMDLKATLRKAQE